MRATATISLGLVLLLAGACGESNGNVRWSANFDGSELSGTSAGGATVGVRGTSQILPESMWVFEMPAPFPGDLPPDDLEAVGGALLAIGPDRDVLDAVTTPRGIVALLRDPAGGIELAWLGPEATRAAPAPEDAEQVVLAGEDPLRVWVVLPDGLASLATLVF